MADNPTMRMDQGAVNARILAREVKADFRRVEAASLKMRTRLTSAEAKRLFVRMFNTLQLNTHFISVIARTRLDHKEVEEIELELRTQIDAAKTKVGESIDGAEALFKAHCISSYATYDTQPLEIDVGILSSSGRRYLEVLSQFDQLMPLLQTLEIHEVITTRALDIERAALKRQIKNVATSARRLATGLRRRMNAMAAREGEREEGQRERDAAPHDKAASAADVSAQSSTSRSVPLRLGQPAAATSAPPVDAGTNDLNVQVTTLESSDGGASTIPQCEVLALVEQPDALTQAASLDGSASDTASGAEDARRRLAPAGVDAAKADVLPP